MSNIKLFRTTNGIVQELESQSVAVEKSLQTQMEKHLDSFLGVTFLATEYSTGKTHGGRIDTLGIDENRCPVMSGAVGSNPTPSASRAARVEAKSFF